MSRSLKSRSSISTEEPLPPMTWEQVERQLRALAPAQPMQDMITGWLSDLRADASTMEPDALLKELLCITWAVMQTQNEHFGVSSSSPDSPSGQASFFSASSPSPTRRLI